MRFLFVIMIFFPSVLFAEILVFKNCTSKDYDFEKNDYGLDRCLYLNEEVQLCNNEEYKYHEIIVHYPSSYIKDIENVVIIGGGDCMTLREVLKYNKLKSVKMLEIDKKLTEMEVSGEVSIGLVKVIMTGKGVVKSIKIDSSLKEDIEVLEDLIVAAMHEAKKNADNLSEQEMKSVTGGMPMPPGIKF